MDKQTKQFGKVKELVSIVDDSSDSSDSESDSEESEEENEILLKRLKRVQALKYQNERMVGEVKQLKERVRELQSLQEIKKVKEQELVRRRILGGDMESNFPKKQEIITFYASLKGQSGSNVRALFFSFQRKCKKSHNKNLFALF